MIFECHKKLDVNKSVLQKMFEDIRWISGVFDGAKLYNIEYQGSTGLATIEIPIPIKEVGEFTISVGEGKAGVTFTLLVKAS